MIHPIDTRRIRHNKFSFDPDGPEWFTGRRANARDRFTGDNYAARLFIGFNAGNKPTWTMEEIIAMVKDLRTKQGQLPDATYIATKGVFTHGSGRTVVEDGCQVIIFAMDEEPATFEENVLLLAEELVVLLGQEAIFVEIQKNGLQTGLHRARP